MRRAHVAQTSDTDSTARNDSALLAALATTQTDGAGRSVARPLGREPSMLKRLLVLLPAVLFAACEPSTSTRGQLITCETDPDSGVVTHCAPGEPEEDGGDHSCQDIDEDGDGDPTDDNEDEGDEGDEQPEGTSDGDHYDCTADCEETPDSDGDGIDDDHDCDEQEGEDDCNDGGGDGHHDDDDNDDGTSALDDAGETPMP